MDRLFRRQGLRHPGPLDRLAFIGDRAMGALRFVPATDPHAVEPDWSLLALARESERALAGEAGVALRELALTGGSPQGARPKALVQHDAATGHVSTRGDAPGVPWLVKFPAQGEHKEVCAVEQLYAELARDCGLEVPASALFDLSSRLAAFGVARFDRERGMRVPVHSLAGLLQVDFRMPGSTDYTTLLRATRLLTRDEREVEGLCACRLQRVVSQPGRSSEELCMASRAGSALAIGARIRPDVQPRTDGTASHGCVRRRRRGGTGSLAAAGQGGRGRHAHGRSHARPDG